MTAKLLFIIAKPPPFYNPVSAAEKDVSAARRGVHWLPRARGKRVCAAGGGKSKFAFSAAAPLAGRREAGPGMAFAARRARAVAKRLMRSPCSSAWSASKKTSSGPLGHLPRARGRQSGAARARGRHSGEACKTRGELAGKGPRLTARQSAYTSPPGFPGRKQRLSCLSVCAWQIPSVLSRHYRRFYPNHSRARRRMQADIRAQRVRSGPDPPPLPTYCPNRAVKIWLKCFARYARRRGQ